jgi:IclR family transcriptional regulator, acetate operon repressor
MTELDGGSPTSGLMRAFSVINFIVDRAPDTAGISAIAREVNLPKSVTHRILKELAAVKFLNFEEDSKQYSLGPTAIAVGLAALRSQDMPRLARPHLERLARESGETATLSVRQTWMRVYIDQVLSDHEIRMAISLGSSHPLHAGASSRAILAALSDEAVDEYLAHHFLHQVTASTITDPAELRRSLDQVRLVGFAISHGEREPGAGSVAAAIRTADGEVWGCLSLCGPRDRFDADAARAYAPKVVAAASAISAEVGYDAASTA